jgi:two-component system chemotaxis response regulator CheY
VAKILIADDSAIIRKTLKRILLDVGHEVVDEAKNGVEAVEKYKKYQPDLVTMDISMPLMNGIEAVRCIVEQYHQAKIVMISAIDEKSQVFEALECGAKHYIIKPFNEATVTKIIDVVLEIDTVGL